MKNNLVLFVIIVFLGCQKEVIIDLPNGSSVVQQTYPNVEESLWSYFQLFEAEGAARGINIDLAEDQIIGVINEITEDEVIGQCRYSEYAPNQVTIDRTFWNNASSAYKELVIFHELGHCYLWRGHDETAIDGICQSIMNSGTAGCRTLYNTSNRSIYLDELYSVSNR